MPRAFFAHRSTHFGALKHNHITRYAHQQSMDPIQKNARSPERGIEWCYTDLVHCCSEAHTSNAPTTLDPRCSALGCEPGASYNGQAIGSGQAAAPIHRIHGSNEHPVGGTKIRHAEEPVSAAGTALRSYYQLPPHACSRHKLLASGRQRAHSCVLTVSLPPTPSEKTRKIGPLQPACHVVPRWYLRKSKLAFWRNATKRR
jgi:hypothetical protein